MFLLNENSILKYKINNGNISIWKHNFNIERILNDCTIFFVDNILHKNNLLYSETSYQKKKRNY